ncbi:MAG: hypothetical protein HY326_04775 [Chloroflexi bacterium]|nr:hypothetical protein [Chloroflexota bacterium]
MNLLEQSLWWLIPFALLMLVMLHAMMEFTVSLLAQRPQSHRKPIPADELRQRLLAANEGDQPYPLVEGKDCDLEIRWELEKVPQPSRWAIASAASGGRLRLLLDEHRHEVRMNQVTYSYYFFFGLTGWLPRLGGYAGVQSGPSGHPMTKALSRIANRGGWSVRPVLWWFQATYRGYHLLERLTPAPLRRWPARRFWGMLYPLSYVLGMGYLVVIIGSLDRQDVLLLAGISTVWWGIWGFLVWVLRGFPAFWRGRHGKDQSNG